VKHWLALHLWGLWRRGPLPPRALLRDDTSDN
jgi:hypothetical protein